MKTFHPGGMTDTFMSMRWPVLFLCIGLLGLTSSCRRDTPGASLSLEEQLVAANDSTLAQYLEHQNTDTLVGNYGGFANAHLIYHPGSTANIVLRMITAYESRLSRYFGDPVLLDRIEKAAAFLVRKQHDDGTIDLLSTNFHSTPDLAFAIEPIALGYKLLLKSNAAETETLRTTMRTFLLAGGEALIVGGIHTPNHRWVVSMALSRLFELFPDQRYFQRIQTWLAEGIDIDEDGQYTERSAAVYTPLTNRCLITIARITGIDTLYRHVRNNLDMSIYFMHPNGEVVTEASRRQDQYRARKPAPYYYPYRFMAWLDGSATYGAMVDWLDAHLTPVERSVNLPYLMEQPELWEPLISDTLPEHYRRHFPASSLVRWRNGGIDATLLASNPAFFTMQNQSAVLQAVRLASAFFGKGQFAADTMIFRNDTVRLIQNLEGPYFQPFPSELIPGDGSWENMPKHLRPQSEVQQLQATIDIVCASDTTTLNFSMQGTDHVPLALELAFRSGGQLSGVTQVEGVTDAYVLSEGMGSYSYKGATIGFGPGRVEHHWTQLRGADPKLDAHSVYITGYTPFNHSLKIYGVTNND